MRVLHLLHHSLPQLTGYALRSHRILRFQASLGYRVAAVTSARDSGGAETGPWRQFDGIVYYRTPTVTSLLAATRLTARRAREVARDFAPEIIHAHSPWLCAVAGRAAARQTGAPLVYEVRDFWEDAAVAIGKFRRCSPQYLVARALERFALKRADRIVTISEAQRQYLLALGFSASRVVVAPNGVDADRFAPRPKPAHLVRAHGLEGQLVIGYIGSLLPYEGLEVLLAAFPRVAESHPGARLMIVGGGDELPHLKQAARAAGIADAVVFTGAVAHEQILDYYAAADILVYPRVSNPTTRRTTPLKPLEAMAMGKPVVASDLPAMRELIRPDETGVLCAPGDASALAQACLALLGDGQRASRIGAAARAQVVAERAWERTLAAYPHLYAELVGSTGAAVAAASP